MVTLLPQIGTPMVSPMAVSTHAYDYAEQHTAQFALGRLLTLAGKAGLRPLTWSVTPHGTLLGEASGPLSRTDLEDLFAAWTTFLGDGLVREDDGTFTLSSDVVKNACTTSAPGAGRDVPVRLRITVTSDWEKYL